MKRTVPSRYAVLFLAVAALALTLALPGVVGAREPIVFTNLTPAPNSTVPAGEPTVIAANIDSTSAITSIEVALDGQRIDVEVLGPSEFIQSFFTSPDLSTGPHTVMLTVTNADGATLDTTWTFTVSTTAAPIPTTLPRTGGAPFGVALPLLLGLGSMLAGIGLRMHAR